MLEWEILKKIQGLKPQWALNPKPPDQYSLPNSYYRKLHHQFHLKYLFFPNQWESTFSLDFSPALKVIILC